MDNMDVIMNALIIFSGCYLIYSAVIMKTRGEVASSFISRNIDWERVPEDNKKAFIRVMAPANLVMGIIMIISGCIFAFGDRFGLGTINVSLMIAVALLICVGYGSLLMHFQNKYLR
ncbi:MAG: hypothetical protein K6G42_00120 [Lachnospiraceae bacterium]|nr:hypothetical protein [Lachnospiraceae bacterium]